MNPPEALDHCPEASTRDGNKTPHLEPHTISKTYINLACSPIHPGGHSASDMF